LVTSNYLESSNIAQPSYIGPVAKVVRNVLGVSTGGRILPIPPPGINLTYTTKFWAPAYKCGPVDRTTQQSFDIQWRAANAGLTYVYVAWVPFAKSFVISNFTTVNTTVLTTLDLVSGNETLLYVFAYGPVGSGNTTLVVCSLYNSSYSVDFTFEAGAQNFAVNIGNYENIISSGRNESLSRFSAPEALQKTKAYYSIADAFNRIIVGGISLNHYGSRGTIKTLIESTSINNTLFGATNRSLVPLAVEELFHNVTLSMLSFPDFL